MFKGMATINYFAEDLEAARRWYSAILGQAPYFVRPEQGPAAYIEFRLGDYQHELGIIDSAYAPHAVGTGSGTVTYWQVDDVAGSLAQLIEAGATEHEAVTERGSGFVTASVVDPFGNIVGIMHNPRYLQVLDTFRNS